MGYSSCKDVEELMEAVFIQFWLCCTNFSLLDIGPRLTPRTGTVAYEIAIKPFTEGLIMNMEPIFLALFLVFLCGYPLAHKAC